MNPIHPVILSGGMGTRLWPLSRVLYPKQLLPLVSDDTLLQETARRVADAERFAAPLVVCNDEHRFIVAEQLREIGITPAAIVLEPDGRNTAPAAAAAALMLGRDDADALLLILPSDHVITDLEGFHGAIEVAARAARDGALVTFGMTPTKAETGYGYIRCGEPLDDEGRCHRVERFVEKPGADAARSMLAEGGWLWNSGMFLFSAGAYLEEMERHRPAIVEACRAAIESGREDMDYFRLGAEAFAAAPSVSIDYAVMEHTKRAAVVPADIGWSDIGSWAALWELGQKDENGNVAIGETIMEDVRDSYLRADGRLLAAIGVRDLLVVVTADAVLVASRDAAQDVRKVVERLIASGSERHHAHLEVFRPWGSYQCLDAGERFQVKQLTVKPGGRLSLQKHKHRAEHWVVVSGTARVTRGEEVFDLGPNESTFIPVGSLHRLENLASEVLRVIEIQSGDYLGEDDIERFDDVYGRVVK
ncbi:MAG: mannose-1-phosphate guanylyltransferase/mannose-6-phosphate isomerase [Proteobacteria bacterium]|nr:mannose-1-phosphate guanylyltransferase/mannose-6-phosphate isomerase [Pseudomonadota bacterium]